MKLELWTWEVTPPCGLGSGSSSDSNHGSNSASGVDQSSSSGGVPSLATPSAVIGDAVLCSEMGVSFSPCGRYLAACVATKVPSSLSIDIASRGRSEGVPQ